jgi:hypothetical protein
MSAGIPSEQLNGSFRMPPDTRGHAQSDRRCYPRCYPVQARWIWCNTKLYRVVPLTTHGDVAEDLVATYDLAGLFSGAAGNRTRFCTRAFAV